MIERTPGRGYSRERGTKIVPVRPLVGQGSNSAQLRRYNERIVLQALRRVGEASKADLARLAQLTNAAIGGIIQELSAAGLIDTLGKRHDGGIIISCFDGGLILVCVYEKPMTVFDAMAVVSNIKGVLGDHVPVTGAH